MKPTSGKVLELATASDFSQCAMDAAMDRIWDEIAPSGFHAGRDHYYLEIGIEGGLLKAIDVCRAWGVDFSLNKTFEADEWQLTCNHFPDDSLGIEEIILWCPGA